MESLQAVATYLKNQLADVEKKMEDLKATAGKETLREKVIKMNTKFGWKKFVDKPYGVVDNVVSLAEECYDPLIDCFPNRKEGEKVIGKLGSELWDSFILKLFQKLIDDGDFDSEYGNYHAFDDTANGCDEILWDACVKLLEEVKNGKDEGEHE